MGYVVKVGEPKSREPQRAKEPTAARSLPPAAMIAGIVSVVAVIALVIVFGLIRPNAGATPVADAELSRKHEAEGEEDRKNLQQLRQQSPTGAPMPGMAR
jgi:hypothetical protein